jgi:hypothetical protein
LGRIRAQDALKPWRYRYWLFPRDPDFVQKACVVLDLYAGFWQGQRLGPNEYVLSVDEKTIQVLKRCHDGLPPIPGHVRRVEFEYERLGTIAYHAAWDVLRGKLFGRVAPNTCIATFHQLVHAVMTPEPYHSSARTLSRRILDFQDDYPETAKPFDWRFTAADLKGRLDALKDFAAARLDPRNL